MKELKEFINDDDLIAQVKNNLLSQIDENNVEIDAKIESLKNLIENSPRTYTAASQQENASKLKITIPQYKGLDHERPIKFLNDLEKYISLKKLPDSDSINLISQALDADAKQWWYIQTDITSFDEFKKVFNPLFLRVTPSTGFCL